MTLNKCPRCELNYITDGEKYCKICRLEMKGEPIRDDVELCTVCGEQPALPGKDMCMLCLKELNGTADDTEENEGIEPPDDATIGIDPISTMDEIIPSVDTGMEGDLSLEALGEEEDDDDDEDTDEDGMKIVRK